MPDAAARSLRGGRSGRGLTYEPIFPARPDEYFHEFLVGIEMAAADHGQDLVLFSSAQGADGRRSIYAGGASRLQRADGSVILGMYRDDDKELARLTAEGPGRQRGSLRSRARRRLGRGRLRQCGDDNRRRPRQAGHHGLGYIQGEDSRLPSLSRRSAFQSSTRSDITAVLTESELDEAALLGVEGRRHHGDRHREPRSRGEGRADRRRRRSAHPGGLLRRLPRHPVAQRALRELVPPGHPEAPGRHAQRLAPRRDPRRQAPARAYETVQCAPHHPRNSCSPPPLTERTCDRMHL